MIKFVKNNHHHQGIKSIFSSQSYLESLLGFCDLCYAVIDCEKELHFQCEICDNFVACLGCIKQKTHRFISHPSDHRFRPDKPVPNTNWKKRNLTITCDLCGDKHFFDKHYKCCQCSDYNVCSKCFSEVQHNHYPSEQHTFIYIPNPTKIHINRYLLADRALRILQYRNIPSTDQDGMTGWTLTEAEVIYVNEMNNYYEAWKKASKILEDDDIDFMPSIIEHEKIELPFVSIGNN